MFRLSHEVGRDTSGIAIFAEDDGLGWSGEELDGAVEGDQFFRSGHVSIARTDNLINSRNLVGSVGEGRDGLSSTYAVELVHAKKRSCGQGCWSGAGRRDA